MSVFQSAHLSTWADRAEVDDLLCQDHLSMEELAKCLYELVMNRCVLNLTGDKPVFFFKVNDTFIDIMIRDHMIISISSERSAMDHKESASESCCKDSETEDETYDQPAKVSQPDETVPVVVTRTVHVPPDVNDNVFASLDETNEEEEEEHQEQQEQKVEETAVDDRVPQQNTNTHNDDDHESAEWKTVLSKKVRQMSKGVKISLSDSVKDVKHIYFFRDEANSPFCDFVCQVYTVKDLVNLAKKEIWSHGYCMESNTVYDFHDCRRPGAYRCFTPNEAYMHNFSAWFREYEKNNFKHENKDFRRFYVFAEKSNWNEWKFLGMADGMAEVRRIVKGIIFEYRWAHAYNIEDNQLINFSLDKDTNSLLQKQTEAPEKYLERFDTFLAQNE